MRTKLTASCVGSLLAPILITRAPRQIGEVTHVFPNSFYARVSNGELLFVTNRSLKSPVTINVESEAVFERLVKPREQIRVDGTEISVGTDISILLDGAASFASRVKWSNAPDLNSDRIGAVLREIAMILRIVDVEGSVLDARSLSHRAAAEFALKAPTSLRDSNLSRFKGAAVSLAGVGSGFTPSGDDMLGGFLCAYNSLAETCGREKAVLGFEFLESKTTWTSAKLLDYMQRLVLDEQMIRIARFTEPDELVMAFESILSRGHTSGIDIAAGVVLGFGTMVDISSNGNGTETLSEILGFSTK